MKRVLSLALCFLSVLASAQDFQGVATYQTATSLDVELDSNQVNASQQQMFLDMLTKSLQKEYEMTFSKSVSIYKEIEKLEAEGGMRMAMFGSFMGAGGIFYKDITKQLEVRKLEFMSKEFLVTDSLRTLKWELGKESKMIGSYTCFKATTQKMVTERSIGRNAKTDSVEESKARKWITVTAWYTPQIPVSQGPDNYWGLPGLIMEVNDGTNSILCSKVVLNPKNKIEIVQPKGGEVVNREEYKEIVRKKTEEMREMYGGQRGGGGGAGRGGGSIKIQIPD